MSYFLSAFLLKLSQSAEITGEEAQHLLFSRRVKVGDVITVQDAKQNRFECVIDRATKSSVTVIPQKKITTPPESKLKIHLYQALVSESALDLILQKATELGVSDITIFKAEYSPFVLKSDAINKKIVRWQKILVEAAKQSDRAARPGIQYVNDFEDILEKLDAKTPIIIAHPSAKAKPIGSLAFKNPTQLNLIIGPEGGFSENEFTLLSKIPNTLFIRLGSRILRAETAAIAATAILQARFGDLA